MSILRSNGPYGEPYTMHDFQQEQQLSDPKLWIDVKTLMGDVADNIPGLKVSSAQAACWW